MKRYLFICVAATLFLLPGSIQAFDVIGSSVTWLGEDAYLYQITYDFGYLNATATMPLVPGDRSASLPQISYELAPINPGQAAGIVLSDSPVVDGHYEIGLGERAEFTLFVLYRHGPSKVAVPYLQVTDLVHQIIKNGDEVSALALDNEQLEEYRATR